MTTPSIYTEVDWYDYPDGVKSACRDDFEEQYPEAVWMDEEGEYSTFNHQIAFAAYSKGWIKAYFSGSDDLEKPLFNPAEPPFKPAGLDWDTKVMTLYAGMCLGAFTKLYPNAEFDGMTFKSPVIQQKWDGFRKGWWSQMVALVEQQQASEKVYQENLELRKSQEEMDAWLSKWAAGMQALTQGVFNGEPMPEMDPEHPEMYVIMLGERILYNQELAVAKAKAMANKEAEQAMAQKAALMKAKEEWLKKYMKNDSLLDSTVHKLGDYVSVNYQPPQPTWVSTTETLTTHPTYDYGQGAQTVMVAVDGTMFTSSTTATTHPTALTGTAHISKVADSIISVHNIKAAQQDEIKKSYLKILKKKPTIG